MKAIRIFAIVAMLASTSVSAYETFANYVEYNGKVIELTGIGSVWTEEYQDDCALLAIESDELIQPSNVERVSENLRVIAWKQEGDFIVIFLDLKTRVRIPLADLKSAVVNRIMVEPLSSDLQPA